MKWGQRELLEGRGRKPGKWTEKKKKRKGGIEIVSEKKKEGRKSKKTLKRIWKS